MTWFYWLATACMIAFGWLMLSFVAAITYHLIKNAARRRHYQAVSAAAPDVRDLREQEPHNLAWPPDQVDHLIDRYRAWPPLIERLPPRIADDPCGCLWFEDGYWSPCLTHDSGVLAAFIDTNADQWAAGLTEGEL